MREILSNKELFKEYLTKLLNHDIPKLLSEIDVDKRPDIPRLVFNDVLALGELNALYKILHLIRPEGRLSIFGDEEADEMFFEAMTEILEGLKYQHIELIINRLEHVSNHIAQSKPKTTETIH